MSEPSIIRLWDANFQAIDYLIENFDHGFVIPCDHPTALQFIAADTFPDSLLMNVTVLDTDEVHWKIRRITHDHLHRDVTVECQPWIEGLRETIIPDTWFLDHITKGLRP